MRLYHDQKDLAIDVEVLGGLGAMYARATCVQTEEPFYLPVMKGDNREAVLIQVAHWAGAEGWDLTRSQGFGKHPKSVMSAANS